MKPCFDLGQYEQKMKELEERENSGEQGVLYVDDEFPAVDGSVVQEE